MPLALAGVEIDRDQALAEQSVTRPMASVVVTRRQLHGQVHHIEIFIHGNLPPHAGIAGVGPGILLPGVEPEFAGLGDRMENPEAFARAHVESPDVAFHVALALWHSARAVSGAD